MAVEKLVKLRSASLSSTESLLLQLRKIETKLFKENADSSSSISHKIDSSEG